MIEVEDRTEGTEDQYEKSVEVKAGRGGCLPSVPEGSAEVFTWKLPARDDRKQDHSDQQDRDVGARCVQIKLKVVASSQDFSVQYAVSTIVPNAFRRAQPLWVHDLEGLERLEALHISTARFGKCPTAMMMRGRGGCRYAEHQDDGLTAKAFDTNYRPRRSWAYQSLSAWYWRVNIML